jgi:hypothetical protein
VNFGSKKLDCVIIFFFFFFFLFTLLFFDSSRLMIVKIRKVEVLCEFFVSEKLDWVLIFCY